MKTLWTDPEGSAQLVKRGVMAGIRGVALLNIAVCAGLNMWPLVGALLMLTWMAGKVARWFYST